MLRIILTIIFGLAVITVAILGFRGQTSTRPPLLARVRSGERGGIVLSAERSSPACFSKDVKGRYGAGFPARRAA
jgi:hypothetical protein